MLINTDSRRFSLLGINRIIWSKSHNRKTEVMLLKEESQVESLLLGISPH